MVHHSNDSSMAVLLIDMTTNFLSSSMKIVAEAPFERAKIILQTQRSNPENEQYKGLLDVLIRVGKEEGLLAHFRGCLASVIRQIPVNYITSVLDKSIRDFVRHNAWYNPKSDYWKWFTVSVISGGTSMAITQLSVSPIDYSRTRLAADVAGESGYEFSGHLDCIKKTVAVDGIGSLLVGWDALLLRVFLHRSTCLASYDLGKELLVGNGRLSFGESFLLAQVVATGAALGTYPLDTIRRRMMMEQGKKNKKYSSSIDCAVTIVKEEGISALFAGALSHQIRVLASTFIAAGYNMLKNE